MTNKAIRSLEPTEIWNNFVDLNAVPRPSKKEQQVIAFIKEFGEKLGLATEIDAVGNVLIKKPPTVGMESRQKVILQSHLDMVHQKNEGTTFDFDTQGIEMVIADDWVKAKGTTLGADNGLGVATIMAILESETIAHPALEALFTIDEETGMTGALGLEPNWLTGSILLNLDTEEDDEIGVGCAGGVDVTAECTYIEQTIPTGVASYELTVKGLTGGHSGMDIHKGLGNANKIMNRLLFEIHENFTLNIAAVRGGSLRNAIPRESFAEFCIQEKEQEAFEFELTLWITQIQAELKIQEPSLVIELKKSNEPEKVMEWHAQNDLLKAIYAVHNGVFAMSASIPELVETSNNLAKVRIEKGVATIECLTRSSVDSGKDNLVNAIRAVFELAGCVITLGGMYPGWAPNNDSKILKVLEKQYERLNGSKAHVAACHAGLECGILGQHYPELDMISFGPTIKGAHSPDERASISSVVKYWKFVQAILANIPMS